MAITLGPGVQIDRYELLAPVGEGGMATVWVARLRGKHGFEKLLAFKSVLPRYAEDRSFRSMFLDEARIASQIEHPNVCQIFDLGEHEDLLYMVLEYVDGDSLANLQAQARQAGGVPLAVAVRIVEEVCLGLEAAHELCDAQGRPLEVVHRDVSPQNVLVSLSGAVKVIDFGIAHARDRLAIESSADWVKGKTNYMAPEQARSEPVTRATDIWAAGALLYKLITGAAPYQGASESQTLLSLVSGGPPNALPEAVPAPLREIILRALSHGPSQRYGTAVDMHEALKASAQQLGLGASRADVAAFASANLSHAARARKAALRGLGESPGFMEMPSFDAAPPPVRGRADISLDTRADPSIDRALGLAAHPVEVSVSEIGRLDPSVRKPPAPVELSISDIGAMDPSIRKPPAPVELSISDIGAMDPSVRRAPSGPSSITKQSDKGTRAAIPELPTPDPPAAPPLPSITETSVSKVEKAAFMDVRALISNEASAGAGDAEESSVPMTRAVSLPAAVNPTGPVEQPHIALAARPKHLKPLPTKKRVPRWPKVLAASIFLLAFVAIAVRIGVPELAKQRAISAAREHGVTMTIDHASFTFSGVEFFGVRAEMAAIPGVVAEVSDFRGDLASDTVSLNGLVLTVTVPLRDLLASLDRAGRSGRAGKVRRIVSVFAKVHMKQPVKNVESVDVADASFDVGAQSALGDTLKAQLGNVTLRTTSGSTFGPWAVFVEQEPAGRRTRIVFDPPIPDGPTALIVSTPGTDQLTLKIPRTPVARLGIPTAGLGLESEGPDVEASMEGAIKPTGQVDLAGSFSIFGAFRANKKPYDLKVKGGLSGADVKKPLSIVKTTAELGPFFTHVTGTVTPKEGGVRIDAAFEAVDGISCDRVARAEAQRLGTLGKVLSDLARATGIVAVTGTVRIRGTFVFDSDEPTKRNLAWQARDTCGLALFNW